MKRKVLRRTAGRYWRVCAGGNQIVGGIAMEGYKASELEPKWQFYWQQNNFYRAERDPAQKKYYVLEMFPYPSGKLHMGHMRVYSIGDVLARFLRMRGFNVIHPMGWDAFGLPAENAAKQRGADPGEWTAANVKLMKEQMGALGLSYDWKREVATCSPDYYRWNQWLFLLFYKNGLAYKKKSPVNWCPSCQTVLANEQVVDGACWRCGSEVSWKELEQWFLKITDYAERLLDDLSLLKGWPEKVKIMQENWIGRSQGTDIVFTVKETGDRLEVFTTRPDTLFGVTYMVLAPEHPLLSKLIAGNPREQEIKDFVQRIRRESEMTRTSAETEKIGLFTGAAAINPINGEEVPILVGNYVLMSYGTGAVMGVPSHDQRDFLFATEYGLPVRVVVNPPGEDLTAAPLQEAYEGNGTLVNSGEFNGLPNGEGQQAITDWLIKHDCGGYRVRYRLRDWLISRQRYWGTPIPIVYCPQCGPLPVPEEELPVLLPAGLDLTGTKQSPLLESDDFVMARCPQCGGPARRETDTMDTFFCSSWYYLRYADPQQEQAPFDKKEVDYWLPVDQYIGGIEHAVMHLLYSRFFTKFFFDQGMVEIVEPFQRLLAQGMVYKDGAKMSKSLGNVVTPDEIIDRYGADTGRLFILFAAPPERDLDWNEQGVDGCFRFLRRVWRLFQQNAALYSGKAAAGDMPPDLPSFGQAEEELRRTLHYTIKKVTVDIEERFNFNTAISAIMELVNAVYGYFNATGSSERENFAPLLRQVLENIILLLAPFAPHIAEELWHKCGFKESVHLQKWPVYEERFLQVEETEIVIQVNGKVRGRMLVSIDIPEETLLAMACRHEKVLPYLQDKKVVKTILVPGKLVNIVVR